MGTPLFVPEHVQVPQKVMFCTSWVSLVFKDLGICCALEHITIVMDLLNTCAGIQLSETKQ